MKVYLASDHAGYELKEKLKAYIPSLGHEVEDMGNFLYEEEDDYPDFITPLARAISKDPDNRRGVILGGTGQGEAMVANRIQGVRAGVLYHYDESIIRLSREHNNANVLSVGARFVGEEEAKKALKIWLETPFSNEERHLRRVGKIDSLMSNT